MATWWRFVGLWLLAVAWVDGAVAQDAESADQQRRSIEDQRRQLLTELEAKEAACLSRFSVNDCQSQVAAQRRKGLAELKRQEMALDDAQRRQRSSDQLQRTADKQVQRQEREAREPDPEDAPAARQQRQIDKQAAHQQQAVANQRTASQPKAPSGPDAKQRQQNRQAHDDKLKDLEKRRTERDQRLRDHPNSGPPLPVEPL